METIVKLFTDQYGPVWLLVLIEAWLIWWLARRFLDYIEKDIQTKIELADAIKQLNLRRQVLEENRGNR